MPTSLLDAWLPTFDTAAAYFLDVPVPPDAAYQALRRADLGRSLIVKALFLIRGLGASRGPLTLDRMSREGFVLLEDDAPREIVLGVVGRFWTPSGGRVKIAPAAFREFAQSGCAKAVINFQATAHVGGTRLSTETRVQCLDERARRSFRRYWTVVGPFSGLIRRLMLRAVRREALA